MKSYIAIFSTFVLAACASGAPNLPLGPDQRTAEDGPLAQTEDWKDWGPEENQRAREQGLEGKRLGTAEISAVLRGRVLRGCYPDGTPFAEALASDGQFYDANNNNQLLGTYTIANNQLCFRYPERAQAGQPDSCFTVFSRGQDLDFYTPDLRSRAATTDCDG